MLSLRVITIRERGTRFNYFREISRVREMYVKKKKIGQKLDKFARRIMRVGNCYSRGLKSLFFFLR